MKLKDFIVAIVTTAPLWMPINGLVGLAYYLGCKRQEYISHHLTEICQKTIPEIAAAQELKLGIKHFQGTFQVNLACLHQFGCAGTYNSDIDTITLDSCILLDDAETKRVIGHELGHFYTDKLSESLGKGNWPNFGNKNFAQQQGIMLASEGIARYFENSSHQQTDDFKDSDWPKQVGGFTQLHARYAGGFHLVKPIIDRYKKAGIEYLITNPPEECDLLNLPAYQNRVLEQLSQRK